MSEEAQTNPEQGWLKPMVAYRILKHTYPDEKWSFRFQPPYFWDIEQDTICKHLKVEADSIAGIITNNPDKLESYLQ